MVGRRVLRIAAFVLMMAVPVAIVISAIRNGYPADESVVDFVSLLLYGGVGGLVIFRKDGHPVGWLVALAGITAISVSFSEGLPVPEKVGTYVGNLGWPIVFALFTWLTLIFPSGHLPAGSSRWNRIGHFYGKWGLPALIAALALASFNSGAVSGVEYRGWGIVFLIAWSAIVVFQLVAGVSLFVRRRRAVGVERAQLGWVVLPLVLMGGAVACTALYVIWTVVTGRPDPGDAIWTGVYLALLAFPLAFGIAVLRYRLYAIDRIISRTVSYGLITAMLIGVYLLAIFVLGAVIPDEGDLAVAGSTLLAAAVANPLRTRVQRWVDRRFNRARFNAEQTLEALTRRLATEVDLAALSRELVSVVGQTVQPVSSSIWLREKPT